MRERDAHVAERKGHASLEARHADGVARQAVRVRMRVHLIWGDAAARGAVSIDVVAEALGVGVGVFHG